ncbi:MAG: hypothetical protein EKK53_20405 [Burkholderiales bacterium]|nr:MAG: hypothetical protein EKK53_20405 [Burkholderiales bacterium]
MLAHLLTAACLAAALVCYGLGLTGGGGALLLAGGVCEGVFWLRLLRRPRGFKPTDHAEP